MQRWFLSLAVPCTAITLAVSGAAYAQSTQGTLVGTVRDASGAVIPGARVTATDAATGIVHTVMTTSGGEYTLLNLEPATYSIVVEREGFGQQQIDGLKLDARQQLRSDVTLQVGGATQQTVTVSAGNGGAITTETPSISAALDAQAVLDLPANYRSVSTSPLNVIQALPGVQPDTGSFPPKPSAGASPAFGFSIQGGLPSQSETTVDGISAQNVTNNSPLSDAFPSASSIAEIRVDGSMNNAEFGQPGEVTTITKSGTNSLHGTGFWYFQNSAFNAIPFGASSKPKVVANDFGGSVGGPVVIPHLYHGKDKTFFFGAYEGYKFPQSQPVQYLVPTAAMRAGNFSQEVKAGAPLTNPFTKQPYANNTLPAISSSAQAYLSLFPLPNYGNTQSASQALATQGYNYSANKAANYGSEQFDARVDHYFGQKALVFGRYTWKNINLQNPSVLAIPNSTQFDKYRILASSFSYNFTPQLINEFRFGFTLEQNGSTNPLNGASITNAAGLTGIGPSYPFNGVTELDFNSGLTSENGDRLSQTTKSRLFQYADNLTWSKGAHTLKFGFDIRHMEAVTPLGFVGADNFGTFNFTGAFTNQDFADFELGLPQSSNLDNVKQDNDGLATYYAVFAQDDWKATPRLTLTYGLRYEFHPGYMDASGNIGNFDPSVPVTGRVIYPDGKESLLAPGELSNYNSCAVAGVTLPAIPAGTPAPPVACTPTIDNSAAGLPSGLRHAPTLRFLPRFGVAFRPFGNDSTAIRAGAGLYNITTLGSVFYSLTGTLQSDVRTFTNSETATGPAYQWPSTNAGGAGLSAPVYGTGYFGTANDINWKDPYSIQWNLSVDHAFEHGFGVRASYIAMKTVHLVWAPNLNDMSMGTTVATTRPLTDRPFPDWGTINTRSTSASAIYNSFQVDVSRRFTNGFTIDSAYTLAKNLADNQGPQEAGFAGETGGARASYAYNRSLDYGDVYGTRRNRWITTSLYDLPFGRGKMFGNNANRVAELAFGGWQLSNIFLWQSGPYLTPYIPSGSADPSGTGSGSLFGRSQHPDQIFSAGTRPSGRGRSNWINRGAFACPSNTGYAATSFAGNGCSVGVSSNPIGRFGTARDGVIEGPGTVSLSSGLNKTFALTERYSLRTEGTFTNVLNHTNLADPTTNVTSGSFGIITAARGSDFAGSRTGQVSASLVF